MLCFDRYGQSELDSQIVSKEDLSGDQFPLSEDRVGRANFM